MAEFLLTFAVQEVLKKVITLAAGEIRLIRSFKDELSKITEVLHQNESFLFDINTKKLHSMAVRQWVQKLQNLVHEVDDLLDELVYEDLRRKIETSKRKRVRNLVSFSNNYLVFRLRMVRKMKYFTDLLYQHHCKASSLGLVVGDKSSQIEMDLSQLRETVSTIDDHQIMGRDIEVSSIVKQVVDANNQQVASILPIVGMGGLGKTTLAKLVFNHETIKGHFDKTIWVCVSEPFLINKILGAILQTLKSTSAGLDNREAILRELRKEMQGKKYFLVLDDVWNEKSSLWDELKCCLTRITENTGNFIVVTTRSVDVAKTMETLSSHHLSKLSDVQCWSLFMESANAIGLQMTSKLEVVREELVKRIGGLPLVARVLGSTVKFQGDYERWVTSLKNVARTPLQEENLVLSILKLSVDRLPSSSLKQCFAYCSYLPKDFVFQKEQLIQMWMAQGFIQPQEGRSNITMEDIGDVYFNVLLSHCLFQDVVRDERGRIESCKMHDLIHDIACDVSSNDHKLHLDSGILLDEKLLMNGMEKVGSKLHTLVYRPEMNSRRIEKVILDNIVNFVSLRVLILHMVMIELPDSIGKLKHLRYLEILRKPPKSIVSLYNLQTLKIRPLISEEIEYLLENLRQLVNLRHLEFSNWWRLNKIKHMPHLSQLIQLQTLPYFKVGLEKGCTIAELGPLENLKGSLRLLQLNKVKSKDEAKDAKLVEKDNLCELRFDWTREEESVEGVDNNDLEVLEGLQPHKNLQSLYISGFKGNCLPNNIFVENLITITLNCCNNCEMLPMLGQLANLEDLKIYGFYGVGRIGNEFYGNDSTQRIFFPKLKHFDLEDMKNLDQWEEVTVAPNVTIFPLLQSLRIWDCPKLLSIANVFGYSVEDSVKRLTSLSIGKCSRLTKLPNGLQFCDSLQKLYICGRIEDLDFSFLVHLSSLIELVLRDEGGITTSLPQQLEHLTSLQELTIFCFEGIEVLPECLGNLRSLQKLTLSNCKNIKQLPSKEAMQGLTRLCCLNVRHCPQLLLGEGDQERGKVCHVTRINVWPLIKLGEGT